MLLGCLRCPVCLLGVSKVFMVSIVSSWCLQSIYVCPECSYCVSKWFVVCPECSWCVQSIRGCSECFLRVEFFCFLFCFVFYINLFKEFLLVFVQSVRGVFRMYLVCQEWSCVSMVLLCAQSGHSVLLMLPICLVCPKRSYVLLVLLLLLFFFTSSFFLLLFFLLFKKMVYVQSP